MQGRVRLREMLCVCVCVYVKIDDISGETDALCLLGRVRAKRAFRHTTQFTYVYVSINIGSPAAPRRPPRPSG